MHLKRYPMNNRDYIPQNIKKQPSAASFQTPDQTKRAVQLVDNRPETVTQRRLQEAADNSPQAIQMKTIQRLADHQQVVQRLGWDTLIEAGRTMADQLLGEGTADVVVEAVNPNNQLSRRERAIMILAAANNAMMANIPNVMRALGAEEDLVQIIEDAEQARDVDQLLNAPG